MASSPAVVAPRPRGKRLLTARQVWRHQCEQGAAGFLGKQLPVGPPAPRPLLPLSHLMVARSPKGEGPAPSTESLWGDRASLSSGAGWSAGLTLADHTPDPAWAGRGPPRPECLAWCPHPALGVLRGPRSLFHPRRDRALSWALSEVSARPSRGRRPL